ncbi:MAG: PIG-L family deacetylase [Desulfobacteraceae bacterium]
MEERLIPYHASDLTGKKVLVLAPHPDDETIGCGGSLIRHTRAGDPVKVVFLTNGACGDVSGGMDRDAYINWRKDEAQKACACLGVGDLEFWGYEDRSLAGARGALPRMVELLNDFRPQLVYAPSPWEIHPDHRAASFLLSDAIRGSDMECKVAFYEIGQPIRVNFLVDISAVSDKRISALEVYESQLQERPYKDVSIALNRYRSITLPPPVTHAEGFFLCEADLLRKVSLFSLPFQQVPRLAPGPQEAGPLVSVIVRTKDRPALLAHALRSVAEQSYANLEIVLVNDGGRDVRDVIEATAGDVPVIHIRHEQNRGRAAAANSGLRAARGTYLNFLDEDDVLLPHHVETLVSFIEARQGEVAYSNVLNVYFSGVEGRSQDRLTEKLVFNLDFDPDILLYQNYIPIMSVLFSRKALTEVNGFCEALDLFEDWDFWIRVSRHFVFHHLDQVTAEYRFYAVASEEAAHREKYGYDEALAAVFDRVKPYVTGRSWVKFLNEGSMGKFRQALMENQARMAAMEAELIECKAAAEAYRLHREAGIQPPSPAGRITRNTGRRFFRRITDKLGR